MEENENMWLIFYFLEFYSSISWAPHRPNLHNKVGN
jgi:hypothetical protein